MSTWPAKGGMLPGSFETKRLAQVVCGLALGKHTASCQYDSNLPVPMHCLNFLQPRSLQAEETLPSKLGPNFLCRCQQLAKPSWHVLAGRPMI